LTKLRNLLRSGGAEAIRLAAGLSYKEAASTPVGVSPVTIWRWEKHVRTPHGEAGLRYLDRLEQLTGEQ